MYICCVGAHVVQMDIFKVIGGPLKKCITQAELLQVIFPPSVLKITGVTFISISS